MGVLEGTLEALGDGGSESACHDNIIGALLEEGSRTSLLGREVRSDLGETLAC